MEDTALVGAMEGGMLDLLRVRNDMGSIVMRGGHQVYILSDVHITGDHHHRQEELEG